MTQPFGDLKRVAGVGAPTWPVLLRTCTLKFCHLGHGSIHTVPPRKILLCRVTRGSFETGFDIHILFMSMEQLDVPERVESKVLDRCPCFFESPECI